MKKPAYLLLSILEISKTVKYGFWCECVKSRYRKKANYVSWIQTAL